MTAWYNDHDPKVCNWLEELIRRGLLPSGVVDRRSILDVRPADLAGFTQCHFFAGIGGWPYALRLAGWPDDWPVWTGSPPCQPFSAAGARKGKDDARHLAPHFADLIAAGGPPVLFGEQVASSEVFGKAASGARKRTSAAPGWAWIDDLFARLEAAHYAIGASDLPSSSVGAPHIRQRCFFGAIRLADADDAGPQGRGGMPQCADERLAGASGMAGRLADMHGDGLGARGERRPPMGHREAAWADCSAGGVADAGHGPVGDLGEFQQATVADEGPAPGERRNGCDRPPTHLRTTGRSHADHGPWGNPDWLHCRDGFWRPVESGTFPLAHGLPARVGRLRGYGNAINPVLAAEFVQAFETATRSVAVRVTQPEEAFG